MSDELLGQNELPVLKLATIVKMSYLCQHELSLFSEDPSTKPGPCAKAFAKSMDLLPRMCSVEAFLGAGSC